MRNTRLRHLALEDQDTHRLAFGGERGERFQVSVLEDHLIRVQHFPEGRPRLDRTWMVAGATGDVPRAGRRRDDLSPFSLPPFTVDAAEDAVGVATRELRLQIHRGQARIDWADRDGRSIAADVRKGAYTYDRSGRAVYHYLEHRAGDHYYGFGEVSGPLDKAGRHLQMRPLNVLGYSAETGDPLYKHFPFYITFAPNLGIAYGLFYDNLSATIFDLGCEIDHYRRRYRYYRADDGDIDYYFIYGPRLEQVVERFSALIGRMALPPRWSLGYLGSSMTYTDAPDAQVQLARFVDLCREHRIPCDLFHLSSGYTLGSDGKRYVFVWDRSRFREPRALADTFHGAGIKLAANIKPCLLTSHPDYAALASRGGFVRNADTGDPEISDFWAGDEGSFLDFTSEAGYGWWRDRVGESLLAVGIDATWNDNNEYAIWDDEAQCAGFGTPLRIGLIRPLHALLMTRASWEAQQAAEPDERAYLISRSGCPGIQRYAQTWSGDNVTSWQTLRFNIPMGLGMSLSGAPNVGHDVGGFTGYKTDPELFVRWVQNGIFHPRFSIHSWHLDGSTNEPWMYPEVLPIVRDAIEFRYRLIPYLYTLVFEAARTGHPIIRPLVYMFPGDPRCHTESFDFLLGPNLLVASVLEEGVRTRGLYLPDSTEWCDFYSGRWSKGGETVEAATPLEHIPLFVPAGGIIPMGKVMRHVGEQPDDLRQAYAFPHPNRGRGTFTLVEDDGVSLRYQRGEYAKVTLEVVADPDRVILRVSPPVGRYALPYHHVEFVLPPGETRPVDAGDGVDQWTDERGRRHARVPVPMQVRG